MSSSSVVGVGIGSIFGGALIQVGRKRMMIAMSFVGMIGCGLSLIPDMYILCSGRAIFGFASGVLLVACSKMLSEIVPTKYLDKGYGVSTNLSINAMFALSMGFGSLMPKSDDDLKTTHVWQYIFAFPIPFLILTILLCIYFHKEDSLNFHVVRKEQGMAMEIIKKVYPQLDEFQRQKVYNELERQLTEDTGTESKQVTIGETMCGKELRGSSWMCIFLAVANSMTGVNAISIYDLQIFDDISE